MKTSYHKRYISILLAVMLLNAGGAFAQKSVYDVVPGSGPKERTVNKNDKSLPDIINDKDNRNDNDRVYKKIHKRKKHLPPGQAKKIYGGSAKDYAPGQVKKHKHKKWHKNKKHKKHYQ
ncbi:MAG: hypothetical protein QM791_21155 [Ferruginibacter sp.]